MRIHRTLILSLVMILLLAASASITPIPALAISLQEEIDLGKKLDDEILKKTPQITDEEAIADLEKMGNRLTANVRRTEIEYRFRILDDDELNAFAIPGGYIYFTERLWNVLRHDEKVGVLAHEIVHVDRRHALDAISKYQRRSIWLAVLLAAVGANQTWQDVTGILNNLYQLKYSRSDERQADEVGVELAHKAGYNPVGLLLAMRKIQRFQTEGGGEPPKIFSSHPPTKERLQYLEQLLLGMGLDLPKENIGNVAVNNKVGEITSAGDREIKFTSSKQLQPGDVVWVMTDGWDANYENRTQVPIARAIVKTTGSNVTARMWRIPTPKEQRINKGMEVYAPPVPEQVKGIGVVEPAATDINGTGKLIVDEKLQKLDRLFAVQTVWDSEKGEVINENIGYIIVTNPASATGYLLLQRPKYAYVPVYTGATLVKVNDPNANRWIGPIVSIGKSGQTIEVSPNRTLDKSKTYEVLYPAWNKKDSYKQRVAGKAQFQSADGKVVLKMTSYSPGWDISSIRNGFDIYEAGDAISETKQTGEKKGIAVSGKKSVK